VVIAYSRLEFTIKLLIGSLLSVYRQEIGFIMTLA
jgi:hypothetical protein